MLIDGKVIAEKIYIDLRKRVSALPFQPVFCDVLVGADPASVKYVMMKAKRAEGLGIRFLNAEFPEDISESDLIHEIKKINTTEHLAGLIVQLPLPQGLDRARILNAINPSADVDCLTAKNEELFYNGQLSFMPPTPAAVMAVLESVLPDLDGKKFVVVGRGMLVGKPVAYLLKSKGLDVEVISSQTESPEKIAREADVIISAVGKPGLVTGDWVKSGAVVIDAATAESDGGLVGDVDRALVEQIASYLSPVPGGVGPVTVAKLFENVVTVAERSVDKKLDSLAKKV